MFVIKRQIFSQNTPYMEKYSNVMKFEVIYYGEFITLYTYIKSSVSGSFYTLYHCCNNDSLYIIFFHLFDLREKQLVYIHF